MDWIFPLLQLVYYNHAYIPKDKSFRDYQDCIEKNNFLPLPQFEFVPLDVGCRTTKMAKALQYIFFEGKCTTYHIHTLTLTLLVESGCIPHYSKNELIFCNCFVTWLKQVSSGSLLPVVQCFLYHSYSPHTSCNHFEGLSSFLVNLLLMRYWLDQWSIILKMPYVKYHIAPFISWKNPITWITGVSVSSGVLWWCPGKLDFKLCLFLPGPGYCKITVTPLMQLEGKNSLLEISL